MKNINTLILEIRRTTDDLRAKANNGFQGPYENNSVLAFLSNINELSFEVRNKDESLYNDLQSIKSHIFYNANFINIFSLGQLSQIIKMYDFDFSNQYWKYIHPKITELSKKRFEDGHYSDALQTALVEICSIIRAFREKEGLSEILSDCNMVQNTLKNKILQFSTGTSISETNIQSGYKNIFAGVIQAMRNPNAHKNNAITEEDAARKLMIASDMMYMLDKALKNKNKTKTTLINSKLIL